MGSVENEANDCHRVYMSVNDDENRCVRLKTDVYVGNCHMYRKVTVMQVSFFKYT